MLIKDLPEFRNRREVLTCRPDETVLAAVHRMSGLNYGSIVVTDEAEKLVGIMTERDLMRRLLDKQLDPATTPVSRIMTTHVRTALANDDVYVCLRQMSNERFRHLPIVDEKGKLVGMMSQGDFVSFTWPEMVSRLTARTGAIIGANYQIAFIVGSILLYTIALFVVLRMM